MANLSCTRRRLTWPRAADALDYLLPGVTTLAKADVRAFNGGFVRDYRVIEIEREPGNTRFEAQCIQRLHSDWAPCCA